MREHGIDNVVIETLEVCPDIYYISYSERYWIQELRSIGHDLLNVLPGGEPGTRGLLWSDEQRDGVTGEGNPFYGKTHTEESRARMSSTLRPSGTDHHSYGIKQDPEWIAKRIAKSAKTRWTEEAREAQRQIWITSNPMLDVDFSGEKNPFYGKTHSDETRARMSESAKNRPPISEKTREKMRERNHRRWHENRGIKSPDCRYCKD